MRKSCQKSANDEYAHQSMHPVRTVGSVHATTVIRTLRMNGRDTPKTNVLPKFKVLSSGPFSGFVGHARYTNLPLFPLVRHFCFVHFV